MLNYGDISPAIAAYSIVRMLKRAMPYLQLEKFGQTYPLPTNSTQTAKFRRYFLVGATGTAGSGSGAYNYPVATTPLVEGVTPAGNSISNQDYSVQLAQYGDYVTITDVILDTHTDSVLQETTDILGEQAALTVETLRFNVLKAGTNVFYANAVAGRVNVVAAIRSLADQRKVTTALNRQNAKKISSVVASNADYGTKSVEAAYMAVCHPDLESDLRNMTGFKPVADYGPHTSPFEGEIGSCRAGPLPELDRHCSVRGRWRRQGCDALDERHFCRRLPDPLFGRDAFGIVPLKGKSSMTPMVVNPKPAPGDPLAQRGTVGWKLWTATVILQDAFMGRLECAATA
jgi:N4-gp56 family major capsid protein